VKCLCTHMHQSTMTQNLVRNQFILLRLKLKNLEVNQSYQTNNEVCASPFRIFWKSKLAQMFVYSYQFRLQKRIGEMGEERRRGFSPLFLFVIFFLGWGWCEWGGVLNLPFSVCICHPTLPLLRFGRGEEGYSLKSWNFLLDSGFLSRKLWPGFFLL